MLSEKITDANFYHCEIAYIPKISRFASRGVLMNQKNEVALIFMRQNGLYKLAGGGLEANETEEMAFLREVEEETGYTCEIIQALGYIEEHKNRTDFCQYSYCFLAKVIGESKNIMLTDIEITLGFELEWMDIDEALKRMKQALEVCDDYKMKFMMIRDKLILEYVMETKLLEQYTEQR